MNDINKAALRIAKNKNEFRLWLSDKAMTDPAIYSALQVQNHFPNNEELLRFLVMVITAEKDAAINNYTEHLKHCATPALGFVK